MQWLLIYLTTIYFSFSKSDPVSTLSPLPTSSPWQPSTHFPFVNVSVLDISYPWHQAYTPFVAGLFDVDFTHVVAYFCTSFFMTRRYSSLFTHSSVDGCLACFHFLAILNNVLLNECTRFCVDVCFCLLQAYTCERNTPRRPYGHTV